MAIFSVMMMATAATSCPAERAVYTMAEAPGFELRFAQAGPPLSAASDLYARLHLPAETDRPAQTLWFAFTVSNGYQTIRLAPVTDPVAAGEDGPLFLEDENGEEGAAASLTRFVSFDRDLSVAENPPAAGTPAPDHVLLPDIGLALWYNGGAFGLTDAAGGSARVSIPTAMFHRSGCD